MIIWTYLVAVYTILTPFHFAGAPAASAALGHIRDESTWWLAAYSLFFRTIIEYSWGWKLRVPRNVPDLLAPH